MSEKVGFFYIIGETNSGKSTLMNALMCQKVSIVTHKVQTTNVPFYASFEHNDAIIYILDTPGVFKREGQRNLDLRNINFQYLENKNILFLIDASRKNLSMSRKFLENLSNTNDVSLVINKIDKISHENLLKIADDFRSIDKIKNIFFISALKKDGVDDLREMMSEKSSEDEDIRELEQYKKISKNFLFGEITREKIYQNVHQEIPYFCKVETKVSNNNIYQTVFVPKKAYLGILVGENGQKIKKIGTDSRLEICKITGEKYNLFINVEVEKNNSRKR